jgi:hypothetical protein
MDQESAYDKGMALYGSWVSCWSALGAQCSEYSVGEYSSDLSERGGNLRILYWELLLWVRWPVLHLSRSTAYKYLNKIGQIFSFFAHLPSPSLSPLPVLTQVSLCSPGCPGTGSVDQAGLEFCLPPPAGIKGVHYHCPAASNYSVRVLGNRFSLNTFILSQQSPLYVRL